MHETTQKHGTAGARGGVQVGELEQACQLGRKGLSERWVILDFTEWPPPHPHTPLSIFTRWCRHTIRGRELLTVW